MKSFLCGALLVGLAFPAAAQESEFRFLNATGSSITFNLGTGIESMQGPVELELIPADPSSPPMLVKADEIGFEYAGGSQEPDAILLNGHVRVSHPQVDITADKGRWNRRSGDLLFHGRPVVMKRKEGGELTAPTVTYNMETEQMSAEGGFQIQRMPLAGMGGAGGEKKEQNPYLLSAKDVKDWPALLGGVKRQAAADGPSPGKQVLAQFDPKLRQQFANVVDDKAPNAPTQAELVKALNYALSQRDLYDAEAWKDVDIGPEAAALLKKESLSSAEVVQLNRRLLEAAYPGAIERHS